MADDEGLTLNGKPISELRVVDLKKELDQRGLSKVGSKVQLTERLKTQLLLEKEPSEASANSGNEATVPNIALQHSEEMGQNEFVKQYLAQQQRNLELQMQLKRKLHDEQERQSTEESAEDSQPSAGAAEKVYKEMTSPTKVKAVSEAPAVESGDSEMAKSRKSRHASKEDKKEGKEVGVAVSGKGDASQTSPVGRKSSRHKRSPSPDGSASRGRHRSGSSNRSGSRSPERSRSGRSRKSGRHSKGKGSRKDSPSSSRSPSPKPSTAADRLESDSKRDKRKRSTDKSPKAHSPEPSATSRRSSKRSSRTSESKAADSQEAEDHSKRQKSTDSNPSEQAEGSVESSRRRSSGAKETDSTDCQPNIDKDRRSLGQEGKEGEKDAANSKEEPPEGSQGPKEAPAEQKPARSSRWRRSHSGSKLKENTAEGGVEEVAKQKEESEKTTEQPSDKAAPFHRRHSTEDGKAEKREKEAVAEESKKGVSVKMKERDDAEPACEKDGEDKGQGAHRTQASGKPVQEKQGEDPEPTCPAAGGTQGADKEEEHASQKEDTASLKEKDLPGPTDTDKASGHRPSSREEHSEQSAETLQEQQYQRLSDLPSGQSQGDGPERESELKPRKDPTDTQNPESVDETREPSEDKHKDVTASKLKADDSKESILQVQDPVTAEMASKPARRSWKSKSREEQPGPKAEKMADYENKDKKEQGEQPGQTHSHSHSDDKKRDEDKAGNDPSRLRDRPTDDDHAAKPSDLTDSADTQSIVQASHKDSNQSPVSDDKDSTDKRDGDTKKDSRDAKDSGEKDAKKDSREKDKDNKDKDEVQTEGRRQRDINTKDIVCKSRALPTKSKSRSRSRSVSPSRDKRQRGGKRESSSSSSSRSRSPPSSRNRSSRSKSKSSSRSRSRSRSSQSSSSDSERGRKPGVRGTVTAITHKKRSRSPEHMDTEEQAPKESGAGEWAGSGRKRLTEHHQDTADTSGPVAKTARVREQGEEVEDIGQQVTGHKSDTAKVESRTFRRLGSTNKGKEGEEKKEEGGNREEETAKDRPVRKRKWGSSKSSGSKRTSLEISTDSLKGLIEEVKLPAEPVLELEAGESLFLECEEGQSKGPAVQAAQSSKQPVAQAAQDKRDVKIKRTVVMREEVEEVDDDTRRVETSEDLRVAKKKTSSDDENEPPVKTKTKKLKIIKRDTEVKVTPKDTVRDKDKSKKGEEGTKVQRRLSQPLVPVDEPETCKREQSPARKPVNRIIHIINLVRPFTLGQLKQLLERTGTLVEAGFWINSIKSHCYATFEKEEQAVATRKALHGARWPQSNPKTLRVDFADKEEMDRRRAQEEGAPPPPRPPPAPEKKAPSPPVVKERRISAAEPEKKREERPVREWDRGKRSRSPDRGAAGRVRSRSRERGRDKVTDRQRERERRHREQERSKERKEKKQAEAPKVEEEPPAKLLDDLFRKTKATPCIYWLPLTDEQAKKRLQARQEKMAAEKKQREEEEEEAARKKTTDTYRRDGTSPTRDRDRQRERDDRARDRDRDRQRDRERSRDDRDRRRGGRSNSRDRNNRQDRSRSRDRRRR